MKTFSMLARSTLLLALLAWTGAIGAARAACDGGSAVWRGTRTLNTPAEYTMSWRFVENDSEIEIRLRAKTLGWLGFGLSERGSMLGSDIVTASVGSTTGEIVVRDRFVSPVAFPITVSPRPDPVPDTCNDWIAVCGEQTSSGYTDILLRRKLVTDDAQDRAIINATQSVIFAWSNNDEDTVAYHESNRGSIGVNFFQQGGAEEVFEPGADVSSSELYALNNYEMTSATTQYVLQKYDLGGSETKHAVAFKVEIPEEDAPFVHHIIVHDCGSDPNHMYLMLVGFGTPVNFVSPLGNAPCTSILYGWAIGGKPVALPPIAGYRVGPSDSRMIVLEVHLDNPRGVTRRITTGVRIYYTAPDALRVHDAGVMTLGDAKTGFGTIPSGQTSAHYESSCTAACTNTFSGTINVFMSFLHMHSYGKQIWTTKFDSSNQNMGVMNAAQFWSFEHQTTDVVSYTLSPGESLNTHCVYDTTKTTGGVPFGMPSSSEMCMDFISYWPKANGSPLCGWASGGKTSCKSEFTDTNPTNVGETSLPTAMLYGQAPAECADAPEGGTTEGSVSPPTAGPGSGNATQNGTNLGNNDSAAAWIGASQTLALIASSLALAGLAM